MIGRPDCMRNGCKHRGAWVPIFELRPKGQPLFAHPIRAQVGIVVCSQCKDTTTLGDLLTDQSWPRIAGAVVAMGRAEPDRETVQLVWIHYDSDEARNVRLAQARARS